MTIVSDYLIEDTISFFSWLQSSLCFGFTPGTLHG
jgi:hypothetical protein